MLTQREITVIRLCHHEFEGLSQKKAARKMGVSRQRINQLLQSLKKKAPQLFPILTKRQYEVYCLITESGLTHSQIADKLNIMATTVTQIISSIKHKGLTIPKPAKTVPYQKWMDGQISRRF